MNHLFPNIVTVYRLPLVGLSLAAIRCGGGEFSSTISFAHTLERLT
jgi:hypothetical protein